MNKIFIKRQIYEWIKENGKSMLIAVLIALTFRSFVVEPYKIPSGSMYPNFMIGDYLFVSKFAYGYSKYSAFGIPFTEDRIFYKEPKRGDIIVFRKTSDTSISYIKRLIGLPGEEVQLINGVVYINNIPLTRVKLGSFVASAEIGGDGNTYTLYEEYIESDNTKCSYKTLELQGASKQFQVLRNTPKYKVPEGHYFFLGDNRDNSRDSRFGEISFVPSKNLIGKANIIFWSKDMFNGFNLGRAFKLLYTCTT